jgi:hypothetical protein
MRAPVRVVEVLVIVTCLVACSNTTPDGVTDDGASQPVGTDTSTGTADSGDDSRTSSLGVLTFDGTEHAIESAVCLLDEPVDVGTIGEGFRVLISGDADARSVQIVDDESVQWFATDDEVTVGGSDIASGPATYFNNQNDAEIEASFQFRCP